jgi:hypothetical protein
MRVAGRAIVEAMEQGRSRNVAFGRRRLSMAGGRLHPQPIKGQPSPSSNKLSVYRIDRAVAPV